LKRPSAVAQFDDELAACALLVVDWVHLAGVGDLQKLGGEAALMLAVSRADLAALPLDQDVGKHHRTGLGHHDHPPACAGGVIHGEVEGALVEGTHAIHGEELVSGVGFGGANVVLEDAHPLPFLGGEIELAMHPLVGLEHTAHLIHLIQIGLIQPQIPGVKKMAIRKHNERQLDVGVDGPPLVADPDPTHLPTFQKGRLGLLALASQML